MTSKSPWIMWTVLITITIIPIVNSAQQSKCSVFQPFKVTPENAKYQIGGPFPLHMDDCAHVRADVVQELIAVQWALSHWNQNPQNVNFKLAMYAADTCSRERESLSQTVAFLNEAGYYVPSDCKNTNQNNAKLRIPLGLILPSIRGKHMENLRSLLSSVEIPLITYSTTTAQSLIDNRLDTVFSTAPTIDHYTKASSIILNRLNATRVTIIFSPDHVSPITLRDQISILKKSAIDRRLVIESIRSDHVTREKLITSADIVLTLLSKDELIDLIASPRIDASSMRKLWLTIPILGEHFDEVEMNEFLLSDSSAIARFLIIQQRSVFESIDQFRAYFLDILKNNYQTYSLLSTYMEQVYNCSSIDRVEESDRSIDCSRIDSFDLADGFVYNPAIESAVLATYASGALSRAVASDSDEPCASGGGSTCSRAIVRILSDRKFAYTMGDSDPRAFGGFELSFGEDRVLNGLRIEAAYARREGNAVEARMETILNYTTGGDHQVETDGIRWSDGSPISSWCEPWTYECQKDACESTSGKIFEKSERMWLQKPGQLYLMGIFDMRKYEAGGARCNRSIDSARSLTMPASFVYVLETIRQKYPEFNLLTNVELGGILVDACHDSLDALEPVLAAATSSSSSKCIRVQESPSTNLTIGSGNVAAIVSGQRADEYETLRVVFEKGASTRKPLIASTGGSSSTKSIRGTIAWDLDSMPSFHVQARALLDLLLRYNYDYVSIALSHHDQDCRRSFDAFQRLVEADDRICIADVIRMDDEDASIRNATGQNRQASTRVVLAFTTARDTVRMLKEADSIDAAHRPVFVLTNDAHDWSTSDGAHQTAEYTPLVPKWNWLAWGSISLQPRRIVSQDFRDFLAAINPKRLPENWFVQFWEDYFQCSITPDRIADHPRPCSGVERFPSGDFDRRMSREAYFMVALETLIFTLDGVYKQACPEQRGLCETFFRPEYFGRLGELMSKTPRLDQQYVVYNYRAQKKGAGSYVEIGNWTESDGLKLSDQWLWYNDREGQHSNASLPESTCRPPLCRCRLDADFFKRPIQSTDGDSIDLNGIFDPHVEPSSSLESSPQHRPSEKLDFSHSLRRSASKWRSQSWSYVLLILNSILLVAALGVLGLICVKMCTRVVKGNQSLGICLLLGLILMYITVYFYILDPSPSICRLRYFLHSFSYSLCFGVLIVKSVQLRNSETLGFNGYVSYWNYWFLLFFILTVQFGLNFQWAILRDSIVVSYLVQSSDGGGQQQHHSAQSSTILIDCNWTSEEFLVAQIYPILLLSMALFLNLINRNVKRNYQETRWMLYSTLICSGVWILWMCVYAVIPIDFKNTIIVIELILCSTTVLCFMFGPKLYILLSYESVLPSYPPGFKLDLGNNQRAGPLGVDKTNRLDTATIPQIAQAARRASANGFDEFEDGDDYDDPTDDGNGSVVSSSAASTKSTALSHSGSSASSSAMSVKSDSNSSIYRHIMMKKKERKDRSNRKAAAAADASPRGDIGSISSDVAQRRELVFGETISSVH